MSEASIPTPAGPVRLRPEAAGDAAFLFALFSAQAAPAFAQAAVSQQMVDQLVAMQHHAQTTSYKAQYPQACFMIVERDGAPIGRMVEADEPGGVYIVDIAVAPDWRRHGVASALLGDLQARLAPSGRSLRADVLATNTPSRALFRRMGFVERGRLAAGDLNLLWSPTPTDRATG